MKQSRAIKIALIGALLCIGPAAAQVSTPGLPTVPLGYCQLSATQLESAIGLSTCADGIPSGATMIAIQAETANIRYRDDGTAPTASVGMEIISGQNPMLYVGTLSALRFIAASEGSPIADISFYRAPQ